MIQASAPVDAKQKLANWSLNVYAIKMAQKLLTPRLGGPKRHSEAMELCKQLCKRPTV